MIHEQIDAYCKQHPEVKMVSDTFHKNCSKSSKETWNDPGFRTYMKVVNKVAHNTPEAKSNHSKAMLNYIAKNPERAHNQHVKCGKRVQELYPDLWKIGTEAYNVKFKREHPEEYHKQKVKAGKRCHELHPNLASELGKRTQELHPNLASRAGKRTAELHLDNWQHAIEYLNKNTPFATWE